MLYANFRNNCNLHFQLASNISDTNSWFSCLLGYRSCELAKNRNLE